MADADVTSAALLSKAPSAIDIGLGLTADDVYRIEIQAVRNLVYQQARAKSRVESGAAQLVDGTTPSTLTTYRINLPAIEVLVDGVYARYASAADQKIIDTPDIPSYDLAGAAGVAIATDNTDVDFALVAILVNGAVDLRVIFGAEAATGTSVGPTAQEIRTALAAAVIANHDPTVFVILGRATVARGAGALTGLTGVDPATIDAAGDALRAEQVIGSLGL